MRSPLGRIRALVDRLAGGEPGTYGHPVRGVFIAYASVCAFIGILVLVTALAWFLA